MTQAYKMSEFVEPNLTGELHVVLPPRIVLNGDVAVNNPFLCLRSGLTAPNVSHTHRAVKDVVVVAGVDTKEGIELADAETVLDLKDLVVESVLSTKERTGFNEGESCSG